MTFVRKEAGGQLHVSFPGRLPTSSEAGSLAGLELIY